MLEPSTVPSPKRYLAHVRKKEDGFFEIPDLEDHLRAVAKGAEAFAKCFGGDEWGHELGLKTL